MTFGRCIGIAVGLAALGGGLGGCFGSGGDDEVIDCSFSGAASVVVGGGTSQTGFVSLSDGDEMTVVLGPQKLYMVTPSVRVQSMYPGTPGRTGNANDPLVSIELLLDGTPIGGSAREHLGLRVAPGGGEALGIFAPFTAELTDYLGKTIVVRGSVSDACGRAASDDLLVVTVQ